MQTSPEERAQWAELCEKATRERKWYIQGTPAASDLASAARTALPRLLADYEELERKVREFLMKWDAVEPTISNAFVMMYIHGSSYSGPTLGSEIAALRVALHGFGDRDSSERWEAARTFHGKP